MEMDTVMEAASVFSSMGNFYWEDNDWVAEDWWEMESGDADEDSGTSDGETQSAVVASHPASP